MPPDRPAHRSWTLHGAGGVQVDVEVRAPGTATVAEVLHALPAAVPAGVPGTGADGLWSGSDRLDPATPLTDPALHHGARLGLGRPGPRPAAGGSAVELHVVGGPDAGRTLPLGREPVTVGRSRSCGLALADPDVSRAHVRVSAGTTAVLVGDLGSANGTALAAGSTTVDGDTPWPLGARLRIGSSTLCLSAATGSPVDLRPAPGGRWAVHPAGRVPPPLPGEVTVAEPAEPPERSRRALAWVAIALPAVGGVVMAWALSAPHFLFFALLSPVVALGSWVSDRVSGRRGHRRAVAEHAVALVEVERALAAAVELEVTAREAAVPDPATATTAARRRCAPLWSRSATDPCLLVVRLGVGPGPTRVLRQPAGSPGVPVVAEALPVTVDLRTGGLTVRGPRDPVLGVARSVVGQVVALHPPRTVTVSLVTSPDRAHDWRWTRWLPHLVGPTSGTVGHRQLLVVDAPLDEALTARVRTARAAGVSCLVLAAGPTPLDGDGTALLQVTGETGSGGRLTRPAAADQPLLLDATSADVAAALARDLAPLDCPPESGGLPADVRWRDLTDAGAPWSGDRTSLTAILGTGVDGPVTVDLCAQGPHALVAGTTGSGKSELLRTLVLGLATAHPPDRCSFLLVDYKGGAAFAEAALLPHTVGVLTDLDGPSTARALRSLGAELTRRERVLAEHGVRDLAQLPPGVALARLVIVVDEFATLTEDLPGFVTGLVGIAQRGRSLGLHLVLATQRPAGVVSPEIRANCTLRLCLRTTDEAGSRDVLGVPDAALLPVDRPGRALLRTGSEDVVPVQVARVATPAADLGDRVRVTPWSWPPGPRPDPTARDEDGETDLARCVAELVARAEAAGVTRPDRPWLPPLPDRVAAADLAAAGPRHVAWGLVDRPDLQRQEPLTVDLAGGGWLVVGGPGSGRTTALRTLLGEAATSLGPDELHVHVVDHGGGALTALAGSVPHTGTAVGQEHGHRLLRLVTRLQEEVDRRRTAAGEHPAVLLLVDGLDSVVAALEEVEPGSGGTLLLRLVRDGAAVGLTCVLTTDRVVPGSRWAGAVGARLVLPLGDRSDYAAVGVPVRLVPGHRPPGRALLGEDATEVQLAVPRTLPTSWPPPVTDRGRAPVRVVELPADPVLTLQPGRRPATAVALGPGGDEGDPVVLDLAVTGGLLVAGPPGSGRTTTLLALATRLAGAGSDVAWCSPRGGPTPGGCTGLRPDDVDGLRDWADGLGGRPGVVVVDDLPVLPDATADLLGTLGRPGGSVLPVVSGGTADLATAFRGPAVALRRSRTVLLLRPARGDAELLGLRLPRAPLPPRPGSGWAVLGGVPVRVQVARQSTPSEPSEPPEPPGPEGRHRAP